MGYRFSDLPGSALSGWWQCQAISRLSNGDDLVNVAQTLYDDNYQGINTTSYQPTDNNAMTWVIKFGSKLHILQRGSSQASHFAAHEATWRENRDTQNVLGFTQLHAANAVETWGRLNSDGFISGITEIRMAAHSLGGANCAALAKLMRRYVECPIFVHTFGQPKCCYRSLNDLGRSIRFTRWFNGGDSATADPVPNLPPTCNTSQLFYATLQDYQQENMNNWTQPIGGALLGPAGGVSWVEQGFVTNTTTLLNLASWLATMAGSQDNMHSISQYIQRLQLASQNQRVAGVPQEPTPAVQQANSPEPPPLTPVPRTLIMQAMERAITASQSPPPPPVAGDRHREPRNWTYVRNGRIFQIYHNGELFGTTIEPKVCYKTIRDGNRLDRDLDRVATQVPSL